MDDSGAEENSSGPVNMEEDIEEIHTVPQDEEPVSELRRYFRALVDMNLPFLNWALDTTLRGHLRHLRHLAGLNTGVQLAMLGNAVLAFREDFQRACPSTTRRLLRMATLPQVQCLVRVLGNDFQVLATIMEAINSTVIPNFSYRNDSSEQNQQGVQQGRTFMSLDSPFEALRDMDNIFGLALSTFVNGIFLRLRSTVAFGLLMYLLFFSQWQIVTSREALRLLEALGAIWTVAGAVVARVRDKMQRVDVSDRIVRDFAMGAAVAFVVGHFSFIGLEWLSALCLAVASLAFFPPQQMSDTLRRMWANYPNMHSVEGGPELLGFGSGLFLWWMMRQTAFSFRLFKLSLHLIIHSLLRMAQ